MIHLSKKKLWDFSTLIHEKADEKRSSMERDFLLIFDELTNVECTYLCTVYLLVRGQSEARKLLLFAVPLLLLLLFLAFHIRLGFICHCGAERMQRMGTAEKGHQNVYRKKKKLWKSIESKCLFWLSPSTLPSHIPFSALHENAIWLSFSHISTLFSWMFAPFPSRRHLTHSMRTSRKKKKKKFRGNL